MSQSRIDKLVTKQSRLQTEIERKIANFKKDSKTKTYIYLKNKLEELAESWDKFKTNHEKIEEGEETEMVQKYLNGDSYSIVSDLRYEHKIILEEALAKIPKEKDNLSDFKQNTHTEEISLPKISIPSFEGNYKDWSSFEDIFTTLIYNNTRLAKVQKLHYLKSNLQGDAEALLRHFTVTEANYDPAWELLKERYSYKKILIKTQLKILLSQQKLNIDNATNIRSLLDTTNESLQALKNLKVNVNSWNEILVYLVFERLPEDSKRIWEQENGAEKEFPKFKQLKTFLESRFRVLESLKKFEIPNPTSQQSNYHFNTASRACKLCNNEHQLHKPEYLKLNNQEKKDFILKNKLCMNCLGTGHTSSYCKNKLSCFKCNERHHTTLHLESSSSTSHNGINLNRDIARTSTQNFHSKHALESEQVLLATAKVKVRSAAGLESNIRVLIDPASQSSFISERAVNIIKAKVQRASIKVTGLQNVITGLSTRTATVQLASLNNDEKVYIKAFVLETFTDMLPSREVRQSETWNHLYGLVLADPEYNQPQQIDMIIGADKSAKILLDGFRKKGEKEPMAQRTVFGWVILGEQMQKN